MDAPTMTSAMPHKLDPQLALVVEEYKSNPRKGTDKLSLIIALSSLPDKTTLARLTSLGLEIQSEAGDILTGTIKLEKLQDLANDPLVVFMELSRKLENE